jgi:hypothetical protein
VVHPVKELLQIHVYHPATPFTHIVASLEYRLVGVSPRPKSIAGFRKPWLKQRRKHLMHSLLNQSVHRRRDAQLAHPASRLGDFHPKHWLWLVFSCQQDLFERSPVTDAPATQVLHAQTIHAGNTLVAHHPPQCPLHVPTFDHQLHQVLPFLIAGSRCYRHACRTTVGTSRIPSRTIRRGGDRLMSPFCSSIHRETPVAITRHMFGPSVRSMDLLCRLLTPAVPSRRLSASVAQGRTTDLPG